MHILVTNDDGIHSEGLLILKEVLEKEHHVCVVAPERERTCVAHAITLHKPLRIKEVGPGVYSSNGTPADCVLLGVRVIMPAIPDLVISGINTGPNMGQDVNYSGTVAAAREGARLKVPSIALSIVARSAFLFKEAAELCRRIISPVVEGGGDRGIFFNVNVPNVTSRNIRGFMVTKLGKRIYTDTVVERIDPRGGRYYWLGGDGDGFELIRGTDFFATEEGFVSVTPLTVDGSPVSLAPFRKLFARET